MHKLQFSRRVSSELIMDLHLLNLSINSKPDLWLWVFLFPAMIDCKLKRHPCRKAGLCKIPKIFSGDLFLRKQDKQQQVALALKPPTPCSFAILYFFRMLFIQKKRSFSRSFFFFNKDLFILHILRRMKFIHAPK